MRRMLAAVIDVVLAAVLSFLGFRLALPAAGCGANEGSCPLLTPLAIVFILLALALYFGAGQVLWKATPGERVAGLREQK